MSTTVFCTFEQQDLADLAVGKLRTTTVGIKSIHYISGYKQTDDWGYTNSAANAWGGFYAVNAANSPPVPSRPVTVKIVCSDASADTIISRLVNMHAYKIIKSR